MDAALETLLAGTLATAGGAAAFAVEATAGEGTGTVGGEAVAGYVASGALAIVVDELLGIESGGTVGAAVAAAAAVPAAPVAARFFAEGLGAGCRPEAATACGVAPALGKVGAVLVAACAVSSGAVAVFHHAHRGPDWHPANPAITLAIINMRMADNLMTLLPRILSCETTNDERHGFCGESFLRELRDQARTFFNNSSARTPCIVDPNRYTAIAIARTLSDDK